MDDSAVYLLLRAIIKQAQLDALVPMTTCEHYPVGHKYYECANAYLDRLKVITERDDASEVGMIILEVAS